MQAGVTEGRSIEQLDTLWRYEIPEGVLLDFRLAGPVVRACAWAIDAALRGVIYLVLVMVLVLLGGIGTALMLIGFFLIEWFYPVVFEIHNGATPGKRAMGILVIQDNGTPVTPSASVIRNLLRTADFLPFLYATGLVAMLINREFKRLGDLAAGTLVVYCDEQHERIDPPLAMARKPPIELSETEQLTLLAFAERGENLSIGRREELAELLVEQTGLQDGKAVDALYAYANWILKGR
ncbi:MAG: RDD family protein [Candidatus Thiodiazotropha sp.]|nr:RDD family protein [Candidatus Thiodiazotropha sp.]MCM8918746.1 RDD family protein [Candidatus Thiodiazotropha sp.]